MAAISAAFFVGSLILPDILFPDKKNEAYYGKKEPHHGAAKTTGSDK